MSVPPRPEHVVSRYEQFQRRLEKARQSVRIRGRVRADRVTSGEFVDPPIDMVSSDADGLVPGLSSMIPGVLAGAMVALLGLGALWGWQSWSGRVSEPIDDRLPMLVSTELAQDSVVEPSNDSAVATDPPRPVVNPAGQEAGGEPAAQAVDEPVVAAPIVVHVSGAVARPGVVEVAAGARLIDALKAAGGAGIDADLERVNLAAVLVDGERIHVPAHGDDEPPVVVAPSRPGVGTGSSAGDVVVSPALLDINEATADALEALPGVGPSIAQAIVQTRLNRGPFLTVDELLDVPGIGEAKLAQIEPYVLVIQ